MTVAFWGGDHGLKIQHDRHYFFFTWLQRRPANDNRPPRNPFVAF